MSDFVGDPFEFVIAAWLLIAGPAHGLIFAQVPPRMGLRPLRWTEGLKFGLAFFGAVMLLFYGCIVVTTEIWIEEEVAIPAAFLLSTLPTILLFGWDYRREFQVPFSLALVLATIQAFILLAMVALLFGAEWLFDALH